MNVLHCALYYKQMEQDYHSRCSMSCGSERRPFRHCAQHYMRLLNASDSASALHFPQIAENVQGWKLQHSLWPYPNVVLAWLAAIRGVRILM
jgi:hypothetical protein